MENDLPGRIVYVPESDYRLRDCGTWYETMDQYTLDLHHDAATVCILTTELELRAALDAARKEGQNEAWKAARKRDRFGYEDYHHEIDDWRNSAEYKK